MGRLLVALTGIVVALAIYVGINDYLKPQKQAKPPASTGTLTVNDSHAISVPKRITSAKTRRVRMSGTEANAPATAQTGADDTEKPLISEEFAKAGATGKGVIAHAPNTSNN